MISLKYPLYPHQEKAYEKLKHLKVGALTMDMGTGKTRTMLEIIKDKYNNDKIDKILWLCPCSAKVNIKRELEKQLITGHDAFIIAGIESLSSSVRLNSYLYKFVRDNRVLMVVDESTKIKNINTKRSQNCISLGNKCKYKYILTGNPIPKNELDLYGQYYFLDWRILGYKSQYTFRKRHAVFDEEIFNKVINTKHTDELAERIAPFSYQVKLDECVNMPDKIYEEYRFKLDPYGRNMYIKLSEYLLDKIYDWVPETIYRMFNVLHGIISGYEYDIDQDGNIKKLGFSDTKATNNRLKLLSDVLQELKGKVIIFCQYRDEVQAIKKLLDSLYGSDASVIFDGSISQKNRNNNIKKFEKHARFLIANKACAGYSLNLQFCNQVIYYNNDWDYGTREQSEDRIYRIGQDKPCLYIDLLCENSIDDYILKCLKAKENLGKRFLKDLKDNQGKIDVRKMIGLNYTDESDVLGLNEKEIH